MKILKTLLLLVMLNGIFLSHVIGQNENIFEIPTEYISLHSR